MLSVVLMGQAGQIPDKPPPPYEDKVLESWTAVYEHAQILWGECELLRTSVGWIRMGELTNSTAETKIVAFVWQGTD